MPTDAPLRTVAAALAVAAAVLIPAGHAQPVCAPTTAPAAPRLSVPILMYHRIDRLAPGLPHITRKLTVPPGDFEGQMRWLARHGFQTLTQRELSAALLGRGRLPAKPVVITFDDGYRDVLDNASPVISRLGMHATAYVISGRLSGVDPSFLTSRQLPVLEQRGIEIGSHTVTHAQLPDLDDALALAELTQAKRTLERAVGHPVPWLAYPYGEYDGRIVGLARRAGYRLAMTTREGVCQDGARPLELQRLEVVDTTGVQGVATMLERYSDSASA